MKRSICIAVLALFGIVSAVKVRSGAFLNAPDDEVQREFSRFTSRFGRNYQSTGEFENRLSIFKS